MNRRAGIALAVGLVIVAGCGSTGEESAGGQEATLPTSNTEADLAPEPRRSPCGEEVTASTLTDAQFAFVGIVTDVDEQIHPWTTDPENPDRPDVVETTAWVTFVVTRWYTADWGPTFSAWVRTRSFEPGDRVAVGGDAYHTEALDFSGQSGEVEFCTALSDSESSTGTWERFFGGSTPPSTADPNAVDPPTQEPSKVFGDQPGACGVTVSDNRIEDDSVAVGAACFIGEVEAGRPLVWDVVIATTEGDPIPTRYEYDSETVTITTDYTFDNFGTPGVGEQRCSTVRATNWLPEGVGCTSTEGSGFLPESLPY